MGLLRDTYIINKNDPSGQYKIADQLKNKNDIENDIDGFSTINEFGESQTILELLDIYLDILKEVE